MSQKSQNIQITKKIRIFPTKTFLWNIENKANNQQRKVVVKLTTSKSSIHGKTAILAILATVAVLLVPQTTMQSAKSIVAPDLPDPPPHREVLLPPFPPGDFDSCADQMASRMTTINQDYDNLLKGLQNSRDAKLKPHR